MPSTIVVGTNSYISTVDASTYVSNNYISSSEKYIAWNALTDADKEVYLKKACKKIDRQILRGVKALATQTLEFPRAIRTDYYNSNYSSTTVRFTADWAVETSVSQNVIDAQVEESLSIATNGSQSTKRQELQSQGVKSFSLGSLSESYTISKGGATKLISQEATELLQYYVCGAVGIS
jgi:DNA-binding NarL/FixJ family response regulator